MIVDKLTIPAFLSRSFEKFSKNDFLGFSDEKPKSYEQIKEEIKSVIYFLQELGVKRGDKVAIYSNNMPNWGVTYFATVSLGAIAVPLLPDFSQEELQNILTHSEAKVIFTSEILEEKTKAVSTDFLESKVRINDFANIDVKGNAQHDYTKKSDVVVDVQEDDIAIIIYTSGTTGKSKGVMLTHKNLCFNTEKCGIVQPIREDDVFLSFLPLSHAYENTLGLLLPMLSGASVYYLRKLPSPAVLIPAMQAVKPTIMLSVPLIIEKIYRNKILSSLNAKRATRIMYKIPPLRKMINAAAGRKLMENFGGRIRFFGIGGAKLDPVVEKFLLEAKFPYAIGYGLTETSPMLAGVNPQTVRLGSTGPQIEDIELKLKNKNPKTGEGELWAKGDSIMKGYYKEPELTRQVLTEDGWFNTGDLVTMDKDGFIYVKGRSKNVIIGSSGENIYPEEIESIINNFNFVTESLVVEEKGRLVALVHLNMEEMEKKYENMKHELDDKVEELKVDLRTYINAKVSKFAAIKVVSIQKTPFEKTATQKIKRYKYNS